jgi:hypothetical protein
VGMAVPTGCFMKAGGAGSRAAKSRS